MKAVLKYIVLAWMLLAYGCVKVVEDELPGAQSVPANLSIGVKALSADMPVRIIVTDARSGQILFNRGGLDVSSPYPVNVRSGLLNIYVLGNETSRVTPHLDNLTHESGLGKQTILLNEIVRFYGIEDSPTKTDIPAIAKVTVEVRIKSGSTTEGEATTDGINWYSPLEVGLKRLAVKVSLGIRKYTANPEDEIMIDRVEISNVPTYGYLNSLEYNNNQFYTLDAHVSPQGIILDQNDDINRTDNYREVFRNEMVTEYLMADSRSEIDALCLNIYALYNGQRVLYTIPVRGDLAIDNYSLERNCHYVVKATITSKGEMIYMPQVKYQIMDWDDANTGFVFDKEAAITFDSNWTSGIRIDGRNIHVDTEECAEFNFMLSHPAGASWAATLTNPFDFVFDYSDGAVSNGLTEEGVYYKIRTRPRKETSLSNVKTEFYITVRNGENNIELNLPEPNDPVGAGGGRYTINQIPN